MIGRPLAHVGHAVRSLGPASRGRPRQRSRVFSTGSIGFVSVRVFLPYRQTGFRAARMRAPPGTWVSRLVSHRVRVCWVS